MPSKCSNIEVGGEAGSQYTMVAGPKECGCYGLPRRGSMDAFQMENEARRITRSRLGRHNFQG